MSVWERVLGRPERPLDRVLASKYGPEDKATTYDEMMSAIRSHAFPACELCGTNADDPEARETCRGPRMAD